MPGKTIGSAKRLSGGGKRDLVQTEETATKKIAIWPPWTDQEIHAEKWDTPTKPKDKGKTTAPVGTLYEDPDGQPRLPSSIASSLAGWKRPADYYQQIEIEKIPVIIENEESLTIDLLTHNQHLMKSKFMCELISEFCLLWHSRKSFSPCVPSDFDQTMPQYWSPWQHIQPWPKGYSCPIYNPQGKYCVKLHWMGQWRKVSVDDHLPVSEDGHLLLPVTSCSGELWPLILSKAILKIMNLESVGEQRESCDMSVIQTLTGWICEEKIINNSYKAWDKLTLMLPKWIRNIEDDSGVRKHDINTLIVSSLTPRNTINKDEGSLNDSTHPILISQWRDEPLQLPPKGPSLPVLQYPCYLGLTHRKSRPGYPPPTPPKTDHRSFEIISPFISSSSSSTPESDVSYLSSIWMDLNEFEDTFSEILIYTKPESFTHNESCNDLSMTNPNSVIPITKKLTTMTSSVQISQNKVTDPSIIFVDVYESTELVFSYSCISCWYEGGNIIGAVPISSLGLKKTLLSVSPNHEDGENKDDDEVTILPGSLILEWYTWQQHTGGGDIVLKINTVGRKTKSLQLSAGRHVLKLYMDAPMGYQLTIFSQSNFTLTNEEGVWPLLGMASQRFIHSGEEVCKVLMKYARNRDDNLLHKLCSTFLDLHMKKSHVIAVRVSLLRILHVMGPHIGLDSSQLFSWKSFVLNCMALVAENIPSDEETTVRKMNMAEMRKVKFMLGDVELNVDDKGGSEQKETGGGKSTHPLKKMKAIDIEDEDEEEKKEEEEEEDDTDIKEQENISDSVSMLESHTAALGEAMFKCLYALRPDILGIYDFGTNEHTRAYYNKFNGIVPQLEPSKWTILFRNILHVPCSQKVTFKLMCPVKTCQVKVTDNDTELELIKRLRPFDTYYIEPNKNGYTMLGEVWSQEDSIEGGGDWNLVVMSSSVDLPTINMTDEKLNCDFHVSESKNYYLPDRDFVMLRYVMIVNEKCQVTIQLSTSKPNVHFKVQVFDGDNVLTELEGCGHCVIPSLFLSPIETRNTDEESGTVTESRKYSIQAFVLYDSWSVTDSAWPYISMIKSMENDARLDKSSSSKKGKSRVGTKTPKTSAPPQPLDGIDVSKPHWILRVVTDLEKSESIKVEEDKGKEEELKMMIQTWDTDQPGRSKKAQQSRQKFLDLYALNKEELPDDVSTTLSDAGTGSTVTGGGVAVPQFSPIPLRPFNLTQYYISSSGPPCILDESLESRRHQERQKVICGYKEWRRKVKTVRELDSETRDDLKTKQITLAEKWQTELEETRKDLNTPREMLREKYLAKQKEIAAQKQNEELQQNVSVGRDSKVKTPKGKKK